MKIEIAKRLYEYRRASGLSQEQVAAKISISRQAVSKWECAESSPDTDNLIALAMLYEVTVDELLFADPEKNGSRNDERDYKDERRRGRRRENEFDRRSIRKNRGPIRRRRERGHCRR